MEYAKCLLYWYEQNVGSAPDRIEDFCTLVDHGDGQGVHPENWDVPGHEPPTRQELEALEPDAAAWYDNREKEKLSDSEKMPRQLKGIVKAIFVWINDIAPVDKQKTIAEFRQAVKDNL